MAYTLKPLPEYRLPEPAKGVVGSMAEAVVQPAKEAVVEPVAEPVAKSPIRAVNQALVRTRGGHPFYVPSQRKLLAPKIPTPLVLDRWVMNQIKNGLLEICDA